MKKILYIIMSFLYYNISFSYSASSQTILGQMLNGVKPAESTVQLGVGKDGVTNVFIYIKDKIFEILPLIIIGVFIYIGYKIIASKGNPEEFKKALKLFVYTVLGIFIISISWLIVKMITGFTFN